MSYLLFKASKLIHKISINKNQSLEEVLPMMAANMDRYRIELIKKGEHNKEIEIVKNLLKAGSEYNFVAKMTGLPIEKIKNLKI